MSSWAGFPFLPVRGYVIRWRNGTHNYDYPRFELSEGIADGSDQCSVRWFVLKKRKWDLITLYCHQMNFTGCLWASVGNRRWQFLRTVNSAAHFPFYVWLRLAHSKHREPFDPQARSFKFPKRSLESASEPSFVLSLHLSGIRCLPVCGLSPLCTSSKLSSRLPCLDGPFRKCRWPIYWIEYVCVCVHGVLIVGSLIISGEERVFFFFFFFFSFSTMHLR